MTRKNSTFSNVFKLIKKNTISLKYVSHPVITNINVRRKFQISTIIPF